MVEKLPQGIFFALKQQLIQKNTNLKTAKTAIRFTYQPNSRTTICENVTK